MTPLTSEQLLAVWEAGASQPDYWRAQALLAAARPELSTATISRFSLGERDRQLLALRALLFGNRMNAVLECPTCNELLEFELSSPAGLPVGPPPDEPSEHHLQIGQWHIRFRLPDSANLAALSAKDDIEAGRIQLLQNCLLEAAGPEGPVAPDEAPAEILDQIEQQMAALDPDADMMVELVCPACSYAALTSFDVPYFFWHEIEQWARHTLYEIHVLAAAYGWNEAEILALSPYRRQQYMRFIYA